MKYIFTFSLLVIIFICSDSLRAQQASSFTNQADQSDGRPAPTMRVADFVPGEVLVKFKDDIVVSPGNNLKSAGISSVDRILKANGGTSLEKLFPAEKKLKSALVVKDPQGRDMKIPSLHNIYKIILPKLKSSDSNPADIFKFIEELKAMPEVEYAEPNYIFTIGDFASLGPEMSLDEAIKQTVNSEISSNASGLIPNDPLYNSQWGIPATKIDVVWNTTTGDSTSIIAILDTGVDWLHPDLAANIWTNKQEIPDNGQDDDGNGKIDDIRGWDFINNDNDPKDDNSHGTHCAGIAAAVGNNGIGIAGANWHAKIMPVKVFQSSGRGDLATIAQGVTYAVNNGATVLNMSFGAYSESLTLKNALASAYATTVLVAAAGNDGLCIGPGKCPDRKVGVPFYPGSYSFVLGVVAPPRPPDGFTNYDQDGPVFSQYYDLLNYELMAPGTGILSCVPGGNYRAYSGTSMAAPLVSGAVSIYRKLRPSESQEIIFGNFINALSDYIDLDKSLNIIPVPKLNTVSFQVIDTLDGDRDGRADAGETIEIKVKVRNTWGQANDVKVGIEFGEFEDHSTATILNAEASIGSVSAYAFKENTVSLKIKLASNLVDGRDVIFNLKSWYGDHQGEKNQQIIINVENGVELKGIISNNMTLDPRKQYIISDNIAIPLGITMTIKPGTKLKFCDGKSMVIAGKVIAVGKPDSLIIFTKRDHGDGWNGIQMENNSTLRAEYTVFQHVRSNSWAFYLNTQDQKIKDCSFINNISATGLNGRGVENSCFYNNTSGGIVFPTDNAYLNNNIINNFVSGVFGAVDIYNLSGNFFKNNIFSNVNSYNGKENNINAEPGSPFSVVSLDSIYYGTTNEDKINNAICDFPEQGQGIWFDILKKMSRPSREAHGIVWKVVINGKDAQDEYDKLDPLGVGKQKFQVYFNRPMDTKFPPTVSMGVRYPFSQTSLAENGTWSADSTIYTVYGTVKLTTGDGINTIRVTGAKDKDHFEIPVEDRRFRVIVSATGSASNEFMATPGLGKVALEWNSADLEDGLGYNLYRMKQINDSTLAAPEMINNTLIADTVYTDFKVIPNQKYFYYYKIVRTNLDETDSSKVVSAIPFTASKGDANGDLTVNVLDVTSIVSYLLNKNPQPFIFEAADMNSDKTINILDVIAAVNKITGSGKKSAVSSTNIPPAYIYLDKNEISFKTQYSVSALQFELEGTGIENITLSSKQKGFELVYAIQEGKLTGIVFSFDNKSLPTEMTGILDIQGNCSGLKWGNLLGGDAQGNPVKVIPDELHSYSLSDCDLAAYPNPFNLSTTISYSLRQDAHVQLEIYDMYGRLVHVLLSANQSEGQHQQTWKGGSSSGNKISQGFYFCRLTAKSIFGESTVKSVKLLWIGQQ